MNIRIDCPNRLPPPPCMSPTRLPGASALRLLSRISSTPTASCHQLVRLYAARFRRDCTDSSLRCRHLIEVCQTSGSTQLPNCRHFDKFCRCGSRIGQGLQRKGDSQAGRHQCRGIKSSFTGPQEGRRSQLVAANCKQGWQLRCYAGHGQEEFEPSARPWIHGSG
jgi:hypothetical protein